MARLSISTAWSETVNTVKREGGLLFLIAFGLIALPGVIYQALNPQPLPPEQVEPTAMMLLAIPLILVTVLGTLTVTIIALGRENVVRSAISAAARRVLPLLGAALILVLVLCVIGLPLF